MEAVNDGGKKSNRAGVGDFSVQVILGHCAIFGFLLCNEKSQRYWMNKGYMK